MNDAAAAKKMTNHSKSPETICQALLLMCSIRNTLVCARSILKRKYNHCVAAWCVCISFHFNLVDHTKCFFFSFIPFTFFNFSFFLFNCFHFKFANAQYVLSLLVCVVTYEYRRHSFVTILVIVNSFIAGLLLWIDSDYTYWTLPLIKFDMVLIIFIATNAKFLRKNTLLYWHLISFDRIKVLWVFAS